MKPMARFSRCGRLALVFVGVLVSTITAQQPRLKLPDLDVPTIRAQLAAYIQNPNNKQLVDPARAVADLSNPETFEIGFNPNVPSLKLNFLATTDRPDVSPVRAMVTEFLGQVLLEDDDYKKLLPNLVVGLRPQPGPPVVFDPFQPPPGLATPAEHLLAMEGYCHPNCFPYTRANCFDLARTCYRACLYHDAIALLDHAIRQEPQACYYYLKAMSQLQLGRCQEAEASVRAMVAAQAAGRDAGLKETMVRFNGPLRARLDDLTKLINANR
jgi:hypothetical protein